MKKKHHNPTNKYLSVLIGAFFSCCAAQSATLRGSEITLCGMQHSIDGRTCTSYVQGACPSGFLEYTANTASFVAPSGTVCAVATYKRRTLPDSLVTLTYRGVVAGSEITLCGSQHSANGSTCTSYSQGRCESGFLEYTANTASFVAPTGSVCAVATYKRRTLPDSLIALTYHGVVAGSAVTLCGRGYSSNGSTCTEYSPVYCPMHYHNLYLGTNTFTGQVAGVCASGRRDFVVNETCHEPTEDMCLDICDANQLMSMAGTCKDLCAYGATTMRTATGLILPLWAEKQTTPAINVGLTGGVCYVNLQPGTTSDEAVMVEYENQTYHTTR